MKSGIKWTYGVKKAGNKIPLLLTLPRLYCLLEDYFQVYVDKLSEEGTDRHKVSQVGTGHEGNLAKLYRLGERYFVLC